MCEVLNADGTPHPSNGRATIEDDDNDFGLVSNRNTSFGIPLQISLLVSLPVAIRVLRGLIIARLALTTLSVVK